jgi:alkylated DNA repair dioxygenase AlkB
MKTGCALGYRASFLRADEATALLRELLTDVDWREETVTMFGRPVVVPRRVAWYGDAGENYRYAGNDHRCDGWLPSLEQLRRRLHDEAGFVSHFVLLNRYRDGRDAMGWHTDAERGLDPLVASLSLGASRRFLLRPAGAARATPLLLTHGSLLLLDGTCRHALPRTRRDVAERVNLTFRRFVGPQP